MDFQITGQTIQPPQFNQHTYAAKIKLVSLKGENENKLWLQSQGILFKGATPKRKEPPASFFETKEQQQSESPRDVTSPGMELNPDSDDEEQEHNQEPSATPPSRWQQMFTNSKPEDTDTDTETTPPAAPPTSSSATAQALPPPSPSTFQRERTRESTNCPDTLEWNHSTSDVNEWIARVKHHSDKIAEEMFERAGLSPPRTERELRFLSSVSADRVAAAAANDVTPVQKQHRSDAESDLYLPQDDRVVEENMENVENKWNAQDDEQNDEYKEEDEETAREARDILSSWMHMDEQARDIRTATTKHNVLDLLDMSNPFKVE